MYPRIAVLASGNGTTAEAFVRAGIEGHIDTGIELVICNKPDAGIFDRIANLNKQYGLSIECLHISHRTHPAENELVKPGEQTAAEEQAILDALLAGNFDAICLMGYMRKVGPKLVRQFGWRPEYTSPYQAMMLNTHAGLFPDTKGLWGIHKQEHVIRTHLPTSGYTLHLVAEEYDDGPTVAEHKEPVAPGETVEGLLARDMAIEKRYLPHDIDTFIKNRHRYLEEMRSK